MQLALKKVLGVDRLQPREVYILGRKTHTQGHVGGGKDAEDRAEAGSATRAEALLSKSGTAVPAAGLMRWAPGRRRPCTEQPRARVPSERTAPRIARCADASLWNARANLPQTHGVDCVINWGSGLHC